MPTAADIGVSAVSDIVPDGALSAVHVADDSTEDAAAEAAAIAAATSRADADEGAPNMRGVRKTPSLARFWHTVDATREQHEGRR
jgi:hypothetical protein